MQIPEWIKKVQENIARSDIKPMFADEALVMGTVKASKTKEGEIKKEASVRIAFIDMTNMQPIAKVVISLSTATGLVNALTQQIKKLEKDLESREVPKKPTETEPLLTYIG